MDHPEDEGLPSGDGQGRPRSGDEQGQCGGGSHGRTAYPPLRGRGATPPRGSRPAPSPRNLARRGGQGPQSTTQSGVLRCAMVASAPVAGQRAFALPASSLVHLFRRLPAPPVVPHQAPDSRVRGSTVGARPVLPVSNSVTACGPGTSSTRPPGQPAMIRASFVPPRPCIAPRSGHGQQREGVAAGQDQREEELGPDRR